MPDNFMSSQQLQFLNLRHLPARLTIEQTSWLLGFMPHDISILIAAGLLKPLGQPAPNAVKYFSTVTLCELKQDANWQSRASKEITQHWRKRNLKRNDELTLQNE
ncbi:MAG TPA: hypothetical protein VHG89_05950 [Verrucomicrobiae bacterium]|nr:hypothetical protein [Verrucomicrobiae bacterium]